MAALGVAARMTWVWGVVGVASAGLTASVLPQLAPLLWLALTTWTAYLVHEAAHLGVLRALSGGQQLGALVRVGGGVRLMAPQLPPSMERRIALAGPAAGLSLVLAAAVPLLLARPQPWIFATVVAAAVCQAVNLLPGSPDGQAIFARTAASYGGSGAVAAERLR